MFFLGVSMGVMEEVAIGGPQERVCGQRHRCGDGKLQAWQRVGQGAVWREGQGAWRVHGIVFFTPGPWFRVGPSGGACKPGRGVPSSWGQTQLAPECAPGTTVQVPQRHPRLLGAGELSSGGQGRGGALLCKPAAPSPSPGASSRTPKLSSPALGQKPSRACLCILSPRHMEPTGHCRSGVPRAWRSCPPAFLPLLGPHLMGLSCQSPFGIC